MAANAPGILELTEENFAASINDHPFAVIDFWAPWCAPCRAFAPTFAAAAEKHPDVLFAKVDTEAQQAIGAHFNIRSIPTLMVFRNNIIVFAEAGALPASALDQVLNAARELDMEQVKSEIDAQSNAASTATGE
jgi:thioredoxin 1